MNSMNNQKGFTLIELAVVMVISVILMGIAGSIFLSSTGFFSKVTISDQDKLALDKVAEFVIGEVKYATDVVVSDKQLTKDNYSSKADQENTHNISDIESWHYFFVDQETGRLFHDSIDKGVFHESYYSGRKLILVAKKYEFYRMDLNFSFIGRDNDETYQTSTSLILPNVQLQYQNDGIKTMFFHGKEVDSSNPGTGSKGIFIYYKRDAISKDSNIKENTGGGTIAEQFKQCFTDENNKGEWNEKTVQSLVPFSLGDFVYKTNDKGEKVWYRFVAPDNGYYFTDPSKTQDQSWKYVYTENSEPSEGDFNSFSNYYQGDVVRFFDSKKEETDYIYIHYRNFYFFNGIEKYPNENSAVKRWAPVYVNIYQRQNELCAIKQNGSGYVNSYLNHSFIYDSPYAKLYNENEKLNLNPDKEGVTFYEYVDGQSGKNITSALNAKYLTNDMIVKYKGELYINLYEYAINPADLTPGNIKGTNRYWQKLQTKWDGNSAYEKGDIVIYNNNLYRCKQDAIYNGKEPTADGGQWERVYWETNESKAEYQSYVEWKNGGNS